MRKAKVFVQDEYAGDLFELEKNRKYRFTYDYKYTGLPVSLTMPRDVQIYEFDAFPPYFEGVLPEGFLLDSLLRKRKIDRDDPFSQLVIVGQDLVGAVTVEEEK